MKFLFHSMVISFLAAAFFSFAGCNTDNSSDEISGTYSYIGFDEDSTAIVSGTLQLNFTDLLEVTGTWQLSAVLSADEIGPQIGSGELIGGIEDSLIMINLNPQNADNNVILVGELNGNTYSGIWQYVGFPGVINEGTFQATKQD